MGNRSMRNTILVRVPARLMMYSKVASGGKNSILVILFLCLIFVFDFLFFLLWRKFDLIMVIHF